MRSCFLALSLILGGLGCSVGGACAESTGAGDWLGVDLVDNTLWTTIEEAADDPFAAMGRPEVVECAQFFGWQLVGQPGNQDLDIDLLECDWLAVEQSLARDVPACTPLRVSMWHFDLTAPEAAEAYMAVAIGGEVVWEQRVDIPGGAEAAIGNVYEVEFYAARDYAAGEPVVVHVHNHGQNTYTFSSLVADLGEG